jgi:23S rRNA pseudouridine1911/1915/1917 synthase
LIAPTLDAMLQRVKFKVESSGELLELLSGWFPEASKSTLREMLKSGRVAVGNAVEKSAKRKLKKGESVEVGRKTTASNLDPSVSLLFEDDDLLVVIKPAGLLTVGTAGEQDETLQRYLNAYMKARRAGRVHLVHRLDRDTSGVMMFAKNFGTKELLKDTFAAHDIERVYIAVVEGKPPKEDGTIKSYLREDPATLMVHSTNDRTAGKLAVTHYHVLESGKRYAKLEVRLETGRKNQIRAHFSENGFPIAGDQRYGARSNPVERLCLHAFLLGFKHPKTGKELRFTAPLPEAMKNVQLDGGPKGRDSGAGAPEARPKAKGQRR